MHLENQKVLQQNINCIGNVIASVLTSSAANRVFEPLSIKLMTIKLVFTASLLSMQY